jgi:hypothetical protein
MKLKVITIKKSEQKRKTTFWTHRQHMLLRIGDGEINGKCPLKTNFLFSFFVEGHFFP